MNVVKRDLPAAVRALLVRQLGAAIAQEYRRQHPVHAERPARLEHVAGRVVHEGEILNVNYLSQPEEQHPNAGASLQKAKADRKKGRRRVNDLLSRYRKAYPRLFRDPGFKHLTPLGKLLVMYLLFGPQSNRLGLFFFSLHTAADDLDTTAETLRKALADVATTFGWHFDADARVFYVPTWWKWNPPENANVMRGALKDLAEIPPCSLVDAFAANVTDIPDEPVKGGANILQTFVEGLRQRLPERSGNQKQYPGTNLASNPRTARIETLARKTLTFTDNGDMATVIDTMFTIARSEGLDDLSKTEALGVSPWLKCGPIEVQRDAGPRRWQQLRAERDDLQLFDGKEPGVNQLTPGRAAECRAAVGVGGCMTRRRAVTLSSTRPGRIIQDDRLGVCGDPDAEAPPALVLVPGFRAAY